MNSTENGPPKGGGRGAPAKHRRQIESTFKRKALGVAAFLILAASFLNAMFGERGVLGLMSARGDYRALSDEVAALETDIRRLSAEIDGLRTDPFVVERLAREVLGMARPGEISVEIRQPDSP